MKEPSSRRDSPSTGVSRHRVLFAVDSLFPGFGGAEKQALKLARALRDYGWEVDFLAPQISPQQPLNEILEGFQITRLAYPQIAKLGALVLMMKFRQYLISNAHRYSAVHVHITHLLSAAAGYARNRSQLPVITKVSGYYEFEGGVLDERYRFNPVNLLIRQGLKHIDYVQTISMQTRQKLLLAGFPEESIRCIPNGIEANTDPVKPLINRCLRVGYCGRLREVKGVHVLLSAIHQFHHSRPESPIQLSVAGDGEALNELQALARQLNISEHVQWLGRLEETSAFLQSLDIYVQPSFVEGLPNAVMEAMVQQRPVIATAVGGNSDLITDDKTGLLFPAGDVEALTACLVRLADDSGLRDSLALSGRQEIITHFGFDQSYPIYWNSIVAAIEKLVVVVSIDTECDHDPHWVRSSPLTFQSVLTGIPDRLQPAFEACGAVPTYLLTVEVMQDQSCVELLGGLHGQHELGTHLHAAFIEPQRKFSQFEGVDSPDFQCAYSEEVEKAKLHNLTELFKKRFGYPPRSFRAGRFGAAIQSINSLQQLGYYVDTSVTPHLQWSEPNASVDFRGAPEQPYFPSHDSLLRSSPHADTNRILEVPVTVKPRWFRSPRWFRPWFSSVRQMQKIVQYHLTRYQDSPVVVLNMMFHSMEVIEAASPYPQSTSDVERYVDDMYATLQWCADEGACFSTLSGLRQEFSSRQ